MSTSDKLHNHKKKDLPEMEQIKDAIGIDSDGAPLGRVVGPVADRVGEGADRGRRHGVVGLDLGALLITLVLVVIVVAAAHLDVLGRRDGGTLGLAADAVGNVDAGLGGVAGLARVCGRVVGAGTMALSRVGIAAGLGLAVVVGGSGGVGRSSSSGRRRGGPGLAATCGGGGRLWSGGIAVLAGGVAGRGLKSSVLVGHGGGGGAGTLALTGL